MNSSDLPAAFHTTPTVAEFDALHDEPEAWRPMLDYLARQIGAQPAELVLMLEGTVLVALLGRSRVLKLYPPFLRDHFNFEQAALAHIGGRLRLATPELLQSGHVQQWPWLLMTQLSGDPLTADWPTLDETQKCELLATLGALAAQVHAMPVGPLVRCAPRWTDFLAGQRQRCRARQQRTGLPPHLLEQLEDFLSGPLPEGPDVILTGEYTPMNLLASNGQLVGMYDFGDGLVGPKQYDWLGPLTFLAAGQAGRCRAFFEGYGVSPSLDERLALMRLLLLHRYSNLQAQIAHPGWQEASSFEELTALIWP